jgi:hypothetical protein
MKGRELFACAMTTETLLDSQIALPYGSLACMFEGVFCSADILQPASAHIQLSVPLVLTLTPLVRVKGCRNAAFTIEPSSTRTEGTGTEPIHVASQ